MRKKVECYEMGGKYFADMESVESFIRSRFPTRWMDGVRRVEEGKYTPVRSNPKTPRSFSLQNRMPPVYDQASRGTCTANAATALMEYYTGGKTRFSVQYLYARMKLEEVADNRKAAMELAAGKLVSDLEIRERLKNVRRNADGDMSNDALAAWLYDKPVKMDDGSTAKYVFRVLEKYGICTYDKWPYAREQLIDREYVADPENQRLPDGADEDAKRHRLNDAYYIFPSPNNVEEIKNYLCGLHYRPMPVYIGARLFQGPDGKVLPEENGIVQLPKTVAVDVRKVKCEVEVNVLKKDSEMSVVDVESSETVRTMRIFDSNGVGGHAMLLVGYADDETVAGGGYFIVRNSWGEEWGEQGYGKIPYAYIELFTTSAATIRVPKDEDDPQSLPPVVDDPLEMLRPYLAVADRDMKDRHGKISITRGSRIIIDDDGLADHDTSLNRRLFAKQGYKWSAPDGAEATSAEGCDRSVPSAGGVPVAFARYTVALETAFGASAGTSVEFPELGDVRKGGLFRFASKIVEFAKETDLSSSFKAPLRIYAVHGKKTTFRIAVVSVKDAEHAEIEVLRARELVFGYVAGRKYSPSSCVITVIVSDEDLKGCVRPHLASNDVQIVLDFYSAERGWRVATAEKGHDAAWVEWLKRLSANTPAQWRNVLVSAWEAISLQGGHVTLGKMSALIGLPGDVLASFVRDFMCGWKVAGDKVVKS